MINSNLPNIEQQNIQPSEFGEFIEEKAPNKLEFGEFVQKPETKYRNIERNIARSGLRAAESIGAIPGELESLALHLPGGIAKLFGYEAPGQEKILEKTEKILRRAPTSEELKKPIKEITKGHFEPRSPGEEFSDEVIDFTAPLLIGVNNPRSFIRLSLSGLGATGIGKGVEKTTGSKTAGKTAQMGSYFLLSLFNPKGMTRYIDNLYNKADELGKNIKLPTSKYYSQLDELSAEINKSKAPSTAQEKILKKIEEIKEKGGKEMTAEEFRETKKSLNSDIKDLRKETTDKKQKRLLNSYMTRLSGITRSSLKQTEKTHPEFWKYQSAADEAYGVKEESQLIQKTLQKVLGDKFEGLKKSLPFMFHAGEELIGPVGKGLRAVTPPYYLARFLYRYSKSPALRKYYNQMLTGAVEENPNKIKSAAKKLEPVLEKEPITGG